jgi:hypothetical protein
MDPPTSQVRRALAQALEFGNLRPEPPPIRLKGVAIEAEDRGHTRC